jgi:hypothetical protein
MANASRQASSTSSAGPRPWGEGARVLVSCLLIWHIIALLVGPVSVPPSMLGDALSPLFRPYMQATYLNHGYKFFAPDPGPSHLIQYDIELADGTHRVGRFPSLAEHWPRLLYHRHFMLTEFLGNAPPPSDFDPNLPWDKQPMWPWQREYVRSYAEHLLAASGGRRVRIEMVEHALPSPAQVKNGVKLNDPASYRTRVLGTFVMGAP